MSRRVLGLDVGGANLKAAHSDGIARLQPFALWKDPGRLPTVLRDLLAAMPAADALAVTMTGELCDCFPTKRDGVAFIISAVRGAVRMAGGGLPVCVWLTDGRFGSAREARAAPQRAAAANWHALATFAGRFIAEGPGLLVDIGSTTADVIPLCDGRPVPEGLTDEKRLRSRELVYTGVRRTPVCALVRGAVAAEVFATTLDVYLALEEAPEDGGTDTADGRPASRSCAHARLARMLGGDAETCTPRQTRRLAARAARAQEQLLRRAVARVSRRLPAPPRAAVLAGSGEFLARRVLWGMTKPGPNLVSLAERLGPGLSSAACAYAVAVLAAEGEHG
jgi:probable H4MPT-linked C1 transfer pathway protein